MKCASFRQAWFRVVVAKLLIVDDHPLVRRGIVEVLAEAFPGGHIAEASDGAEALQAVNVGAWDLVVLDGTFRSYPTALPCPRWSARAAAGSEPSGPSPRSSRARYPTDWPSFPIAAGCARRPEPGLLPASIDPSTASQLDGSTPRRLYATSPPSRPSVAPDRKSTRL